MIFLKQLTENIILLYTLSSFFNIQDKIWNPWQGTTIYSTPFTLEPWTTGHSLNIPHTLPLPSLCSCCFILFSNYMLKQSKVRSLSYVWLCVTRWTVAYHAPPSMGFSRQVGCHFPLEWVAISFSRGSSWPKDRTWVFRIVGRRFTFWVTREVCSFILFSNHTLKPYLFYKVQFTCFHLPLIILELLFSHWVMSVSFVTQ